MDEKQYVITPEMVYGKEWIARHADELERWEWGFRAAACGETFLPVHPSWSPIPGQQHGHPAKPRIILIRRKIPPAPQLREWYGKDRVEIQADKEWTGEARSPSTGEQYLVASRVTGRAGANRDQLSLILRDRKPPVKVWYRAEEKERQAKEGEWVWDSTYKNWEVVRSEWLNDIGTTTYTYLCATRHEEVDTTPTVVTQADVDAAWAKQHGGGE